MLQPIRTVGLCSETLITKLRGKGFICVEDLINNPGTIKKLCGVCFYYCYVKEIGMYNFVLPKKRLR